MGIISTKLRKSAQGQQCQFQIPGFCNHNPETVVLCHAPSEIKGLGNKGHDYHAAFGCSACHEALDHHKLDRWEELYFWYRGVMRTQNIWVEKGLLVIPVDPATAKRRPKRKAKMPSRPIPSRPFQKPGDTAKDTVRRFPKIMSKLKASENA